MGRQPFAGAFSKDEIQSLEELDSERLSANWHIVLLRNLAQICVASGCLTSGSLGMGSSVREKVLPVREKVSSVYQKGQIYSKLSMC